MDNSSGRYKWITQARRMNRAKMKASTSWVEKRKCRPCVKRAGRLLQTAEASGRLNATTVPDERALTFTRHQWPTRRTKGPTGSCKSGGFCGWPQGPHTSPAPLTWRSCYGSQLLLSLPSQTDAAWSAAAPPHDKETSSRRPHAPRGRTSPHQQPWARSDGRLNPLFPHSAPQRLASLPQGLRGVEAGPGLSHALLLLWAVIFHVGEPHLVLELRAQGKEGDPGEGA